MRNLLLLAVAIVSFGAFVTGCAASGDDASAPKLENAPKGDDSTPTQDGQSAGQGAATPTVSND